MAEIAELETQLEGLDRDMNALWEERNLNKSQALKYSRLENEAKDPVDKAKFQSEYEKCIVEEHRLDVEIEAKNKEMTFLGGELNDAKAREEEITRLMGLMGTGDDIPFK